jgi:hypothetical protein
MTARRSVAKYSALATCALLLMACPKKKGGEPSDAAADAPEVAVVDAAPAGPEASNADAVARFPDETAIDHQAGTLQWPQVNVRKSPPSGEVIASLPKGTSTTQIASHDNYLLVVFENPKSSGEHLMGWVLKDVFSAQPTRPSKSLCPAGQVPLIGDALFCGKVCKVDTDCIGGQACMGTANLATGDGGVGAQVHTCTAIARPDAGAPPPVKVDAGAPTVDAGVAKDAGAPAKDAGGSGSAVIIVDPGANKSCAAGYKFVDYDSKCHKTCATAADCGGPGVICTRGKYCKTGP